MCAILVVPLALSFALPLAVPSLAPAYSGNLGELTPQLAVAQLSALGAYAWMLLVQSPLLVVLPFAMAIARRGFRFDGRFASLMAVVLLALAASLLHFLPGYPAELASRVLVLVAVVAAGIAGSALVAFCETPGMLRATACALVLAWLTFAGASWILRHALEMQRPQIIDEAKLAARIGQLPRDTVIVYFEADIALFASLLHGAERRHAVVLPMLKGSPQLPNQLVRHLARVGVVPMHPALNVLERRILTTMPHRFGFPGRAIESFELSRPGEFPGGSLWLHVGNGDIEQSMQVRLRFAGREVGQSVAVAPGFKGWIRVIESTAELQRVTVGLPNGPLWVTGISLKEPRPGINWPWTHGVDLAYSYRNFDRPRQHRVSLSINGLLEAYSASDFAGLIDAKEPVLSDDSGLVFLKLRDDPNLPRVQMPELAPSKGSGSK